MQSYLYDKNKIGKKIASGGDRRVYTYDTDKVIKISTLSFLIGKKLHKKLCHDYLVSQNYFKNFVVATVDVSTENKHIEIQPFISGELLNKRHMEIPFVKEQLKDIFDSLNQMVKEGNAPLDLVGNIGMLKPCLSSIMVDKENKLNIIDNTLLEVKTIMPLGIVFKIFLPIIKFRQNYLLRKFLN